MNTKKILLAVIALLATFGTLQAQRNMRISILNQLPDVENTANVRNISFAKEANGWNMVLQHDNGSTQKVPTTKISKIAFEKSFADFNDNLKLCYPNRTNALINRATSDEMGYYANTTTAPYSMEENAYRFQYISDEGNDSPWNVWNNAYRVVYRCNSMLQAITEQGSPAELNGQKAEALLCRAWAYFHLADLFCMAYDPTKDYMGLAYITSNETFDPWRERYTPETFINRGTLTQLYDNINADIEAALAIFDDAHTDGNKYRFSRKAAYAFAARFNLLYHKWDKAVAYANEVLGYNPADMMRDWATLQTMGAKEAAKLFRNPDLPTNMLITHAYSLLGRNVYRTQWCGHSTNMAAYETLWAACIWGSGSGSNNALTFKKLWGGSSNCSNYRISEDFIYTNPEMGIGYATIHDMELTGEDILLTRAEASILKKDYTQAVADMNTWMETMCDHSHTIYQNVMPLTKQSIIDYVNSINVSPVNPAENKERTFRKALHPQGFTIDEEQTAMLQLLLHMRRIETLHTGRRMTDIKRYGIEYAHPTPENTTPAYDDDETFKAGDLRGAIQLPSQVVAYGVPANPRKPYEGSEGSVILNAENFPDPIFRAMLSVQIGVPEGTVIPDQLIANTTSLSFSEGTISDLTGIEHFTALTQLTCSGNRLTTLDLSHNTALTSLECSANSLTELDLSHNTALTNLACGHNQLTSLDVSNNPDLYRIFCYGNQLTALDISNNPALFWLDCSNNKLSTIKIDPATNTELRYFDCYRNQLKGAEMEALIQSLPVKTTYYRGQIRAIMKDAPNEGNEITDNQALTAKVRGWDMLYSEDGEWKKFKFTGMGTIVLNSENFPDPVFRQKLTQLLGIEEGETIPQAMLDNRAELYMEPYTGTPIYSLQGIEFFKGLKILDVSCNALTALDLTSNTQLNRLYCYCNNIKATQMEALIQSLPNVTDGHICLFAQGSVILDNYYRFTEYNEVSETYFDALKAKGWEVYYRDTNGNERKWGDFDNVGIENLLMYNQWYVHSYDDLGPVAKPIFENAVNAIYDSTGQLAKQNCYWVRIGKSQWSTSSGVCLTYSSSKDYSYVSEATFATFFDNKNVTFTEWKATEGVSANNWRFYGTYGLDAVAQLFVTSWEIEVDPLLLWIRLKDRNNPDNVITLRSGQKAYPFGQRND